MKIRRKAKTGVVRTTLLATFLTAGFYLVAPELPQIGAFVTRYFCSHPLEYISTAMFFTGVSILLQKVWRLRSENRMLDESSEFIEANLEVTDYETLTSRLDEWCADDERESNTTLMHRVTEVIRYLKTNRRVGLDDHLRYLAELASDQLHQTYATIRTITWAIPILGFLGTVIGITMAIANVTPEQLDTSLGEVTGGLAVAFDTTALALGMSIVMVFLSFMVERSEQQILGEVEQFGIQSLLPWFSKAEEAETEVAPTVGQNTINELWAEQVSELRGVWTSMLESHSAELAHGLQREVEATLKLHSSAAEESRDSYSAALQESSSSIVSQTHQVLSQFDERVQSWQDALLLTSQSSSAQSEAMHQLGAKLLRLQESEERLAQLQQLLVDNLKALDVASTMEQTANSVAAAVHLLTARTDGLRRAA
ncbi:MAG: MotA/TolQ/ExbB proton channel family protein [Fuerstiella sp.]